MRDIREQEEETCKDMGARPCSDRLEKWRHVVLLSNIYKLRTMKHITTLGILNLTFLPLGMDYLYEA